MNDSLQRHCHSGFAVRTYTAAIRDSREFWKDLIAGSEFFLKERNLLAEMLSKF